MKGFTKRFLAMFMVLVILLTTVPIQAFASYNPMTVTIESVDGSAVEGATLTVIPYYYTVEYDPLTWEEQGGGRYTVYLENRNLRSYTIYITVSAPGYEEQTISFRGNVTSTTVTLNPTEVIEEWQEFKMYYYLNGSEENPFPNSYAGAGDVGNYGPSGDDTPFVILNVDVAKLEREYADVLLYGENTPEGNRYQFTPVNSSNRLEASKAFWEAVLECTDEASMQALEDTGLADWFIGYAAKFDGTSYHIDGILQVTPPVYSIELYKDDQAEGGTYSYVGGLLTNKGEEFKTVSQVLDSLEGYLGYTITWQEDGNGNPIAQNGVYTGTYIHEKSLHTITVYQSNADRAEPVENSEISYQKMSNYYYVAYYVLKIEKGQQVEFTVTYTDGDAAGTAFTDHSYGVTKTGNTDPAVPAFTGAAVREGYTFLGWILEGGDGKLLSDEDIAKMTVTSDMVFDAEWEPIPLTYIGSVHVILNGTYDAANHTITSGTYIDIHAVTGSMVQLYVKKENSAVYIPLTAREGTIGIYEAELENGNYTIHYSLDGGTTIKNTDNQILTINNADRHRYLFFNSVEYDLNGGQSAADFPTNYYQTGMKNIHVLNGVPTKDRFVFSHWTDQYGNIYNPGDILTPEISKPYVLTAQWKEAIDLWLNIKIKHVANDGISQNNDQGMHDISFTLDHRSGTGDYQEFYAKQINWDGISQFEDDIFQGYYLSNTEEYTLYSSYVPVLENVDKNEEYTFTTSKSGYELVSVEKEYLENGDRVLNVTLIFDPNDFDFAFSVHLDEEAKQLPDSFKPVAANVKITSWYDMPFDNTENVDWYTITQHKDTYERIVLNENGEGFGTYPVWMTTTDYDTRMTYHYRIEVVSFEMPDGSINPAHNVGGENVCYLSDCEHIEANVEVTGGQSPNSAATELTGAYYENGGQVGKVEAIISIHTYSVTFVPNGGKLFGTEENTVVEPLFQIPHLHDYEPVRDGGYIFEGWYYADENGNMTDTPAESYTPLHSDVTLIAKWKEPVTIVANVIVSKTYEQTNSDGTVSIHTIHDKELTYNVVVSLQRIYANGYAETIMTKVGSLTYDALYGKGTVTFTQVPNDGHTYRVLVITPNYTFTYQNEPNSLNDALNTDYAGSYNENDYVAAFGDDSVAVINAYGAFTPDNFSLKYEVDADAIGEGFRPDNAQILITHDDDLGIIQPSQWPVISQMEFGDQVIGLYTDLVDGHGSGSFDAWKIYPDGRTAEYALRLQGTTHNGVERIYDDEEAPFYVIYYVPAYYVAPDGQSQMLVAELLPKTYSIIYELNGGTLIGTYPVLHTWSYDTNLSDAVPEKPGYIFDGWYLDTELTQPADDQIDASVHAKTTLYAKWKLAMDRVNLTVIIDHMQGNDPESSTGQAAVYDRILYTMLTSHPDGGENVTYTGVDGTEQAFDSSYWHTVEFGTPEDVFYISNIYSNLPSDMAYSALAYMEGYTIVPDKCSVTPNYDESSETGTTYDVEIYLKYTPELLNLEFSVRMDDAVNPALDPAQALVRVTCWYDQPTTAYDLAWNVITQSQESYITVDLDDATRSGTGSTPVWQWYLQEKNIPFFYRIEVVGLVLDDGTIIDMTAIQEDVSYNGGIYTATVYAENGAKAPVQQDETYYTDLLGVYGDYIDGTLQQVGTLEAVITAADPIKVVFHSNNTDAQQGDVFRTYYTAGALLAEDNDFYLSNDGSVPVFYDIPTYEYYTHNGYIFKGWYMGTEADAEPMDWNASYTEETHIYAHWIYVGEVAKEEDGKRYESTAYPEFDLLGNQIRTATQDDLPHYGNAAPGLRFVASLSERIFEEMNGIHTENNSGIEYGFVLVRADRASDMLKYKDAFLNGEDTTQSHKYVQNVVCRDAGDGAIVDHYDGEAYRLYTAVITYQDLGSISLEDAQRVEFIGRAYLRYFDANGLERVHYNNYTGNSNTYGGVKTSYTDVYNLLNGQ